MNAIWITLIGVGGTLLGSVTTGIISYLNNKRAVITELEINQKAKNAKKLLKKVYSPVIKIYDEAYNWQNNYLNALEEEIRGLNENQFEKVITIFDKYSYLIPKDLNKVFYQLKVDYEDEKYNTSPNPYEEDSSLGNGQSNDVDSYCYDEKSELQMEIEKEFDKCRKLLNIQD